MNNVLDDEVAKKLQEMVQELCDQYSACLFVKLYLLQLEKVRGITGDPIFDKSTREARIKLFSPMYVRLYEVLEKPKSTGNRIIPMLTVLLKDFENMDPGHPVWNEVREILQRAETPVQRETNKLKRPRKT